MATKQRQRRPANLLPLLQLAAQPGARLLLVAGKAFILNGKTHKYVREAVYKVLQEENWITCPHQITPDLAECRVTRAGYAKLAAVEAHKRKYTQLLLFLEQAQPVA